MTTYDKDFIARMKDLAVLGLWPSQIAERLGLQGTERARFLEDITDYEHPLCREYHNSRGNYEDDLDAALQTRCMSGDPKALKIAYELRQQDRVNKLTQELFGI